MNWLWMCTNDFFIRLNVDSRYRYPLYSSTSAYARHHPHNAHIHARDLHARVHLLRLVLVPAVGAEPHCDHAVALRTLQLPHRLVLALLLVHRKQLALAHGAEAHLLAAERARDAPVRARVAVPLLGVTLLRHASIP